MAKNRKTGKYSKILKIGALAEVYQEFLEDENYRDLRDEVAVMRTFTAASLEKLKGLDLAQVTPNMVAVVAAMVGEVRGLVDVATRVEQKLSISLSIPDLYGVVKQIVEVIQRHVTDPAVRERIAVELDKLSIPTGINYGGSR